MHQYTRPEIKQITANGKVVYNERKRRINLRKEILEAFINTKDKITDIEYAMEVYLDKNEFSKKITDCIETGVLPVLLFFRVKEKNE